MSEDKRENPGATPSFEPTSNPVPGGTVSSVPVSVMAEQVASLVTAGLIGPPPRPGLLGVVDHFELVRRLGSGSMGIVFLARDTETGRNVALKILQPELVGESRVVDRFLQEARRLQLLKHDHLVSVLDVRRFESGMFFVMPYFEAGSLAQRMKPDVPLTGEETLRVATAVAQALCFAHKRGIIHRDIKPGNILLGKDGSICLADFGLALSLFNDVLINVECDQCEGTAPYMSPTVAAGEAEDTRCDIYALGAVIFEMLTGVPPYRGATTKAIRQQILAGPPRPIRELNPAADTRLIQVAAWAMAREHRNRYADMGDMLADLELLERGNAPRGPHGSVHFLTSPRVILQSRTLRVCAVAAVLAGVGIWGWVLWPRFRIETAHAFKATQVDSWIAALPAKWDDAPGQELLVTHQNDLFAFSADGTLLKRWSCPEPTRDNLSLTMTTRLAGDRFDDVFVNWAQETNLTLSLVNCNGHELKQFHATGHTRDNDNNGMTSALAPLKFVPSEEGQGGRAKLMAALSTAYGESPRSLCCFDFENLNMDWESPVGPILRGCEVISSFPMGDKLFVCGSIAVGDKYHAPDGTDDLHAYLFAFSEHGNQLWRRELGGPGATVLPIAVGSNHSPSAVLTWVHSDEAIHGSNAPEIGLIVEFDAQGRAKRNIRLGACLQSCVLADLRGDGHMEVLATDCEGNLYAMDQMFSPPLKRRIVAGERTKLGRVGLIQLQIIGAAKLLRGKGRQLVLSSVTVTQHHRHNPGRTSKEPDDSRFDDPTILVLDANLRRIAEFPIQKRTSGWNFSWHVQIADMDGDGLDEILSLSDQVEILKLVRH